MHVTTVLVTHDQEEAMDVADRIVVMANAQVEQVGSPDELYDHPTNNFVMSFLGPVTRLDGLLVRPHDLEVLVEPAEGTTPATVERVARLGFEVRIEIKVDDTDVFVQVTRDTAERLGVAPGSAVHIRPIAGALTLPAGPDVPADEVEDPLELSTVS
jgi:sulfate transport system ATP-binding protein